MAMVDWNDYRDQVLARAGEIGKLSPHTVKGFMASEVPMQGPDTMTQRPASLSRLR